MIGLRTFIFFFFFLAASFPANARIVIEVDSQDHFDKLGSEIKDIIMSGQNDIYVSFPNKTFYYDNDHIFFNQLKGDINIKFVGHGSVFVAKGKTFDTPFSPNPKYGYLDDKLGNVDFWSEQKRTVSNIKVIDKLSGKCEIVLPEDSSIQDASYVRFSSWFKAFQFPVSRQCGRQVTFFAKDLEWNDMFHSFDVDMDYAYGHKYPICIVWPKKVTPDRAIHQCQASTFIRTSDIHIKSLTLSGMTFLGNACEYPLLNFDDSEFDDCNICCCSFKYIRSRIVNVHNSSNITFKDNQVHNCYDVVIESDNGSANTSVISNDISNTPCLINNAFTIVCCGTDFRITDNDICDFIYSAIGVGLWYGHKAEHRISGLVDSNHLYYTVNFLKNYTEHTMMDSGTIYTWTKNDDVTISNNVIHDYAGSGDNRGIFCDDGTKNVTIRDNLIYSIGGDLCITLGLVSRVSQYVPDYNSNNICEGNIVVGDIIFEGRDESQYASRFIDNVIITEKGRTSSQSRISDVYKKNNHSFVGSVSGKGISVDKKGKKRISNMPAYRKNKEKFSYK